MDVARTFVLGTPSALQQVWRAVRAARRRWLAWLGRGRRDLHVAQAGDQNAGSA
jgi:hypothetical protein